MQKKNIGGCEILLSFFSSKSGAFVHLVFVLETQLV